MIYYAFISEYGIIKWRIWPKVETWEDVIITNLRRFDPIYISRLVLVKAQ